MVDGRQQNASAYVMMVHLPSEELKSADGIRERRHAIQEEWREKFAPKVRGQAQCKDENEDKFTKAKMWHLIFIIVEFDV